MTHLLKRADFGPATGPNLGEWLRSVNAAAS